MASASAGLELPATSLIAPFLAAITASRAPGEIDLVINSASSSSFGAVCDPGCRPLVETAHARRPDNKEAARLAIRGTGCPEFSGPASKGAKGGRSAAFGRERKGPGRGLVRRRPAAGRGLGGPRRSRGAGDISLGFVPAENTEDAGGFGCPVVEPGDARGRLFGLGRGWLGGCRLLAGRCREAGKLIEAAARDPAQHLVVDIRPAGAARRRVLALEPERPALARNRRRPTPRRRMWLRRPDWPPDSRAGGSSPRRRRRP